ncbi:MAG: hypothetical protein FWC43_11200 [Planctomycetaceae bacterium]|nr:hypothetical protein [Planctomycetaceae bacterium]
MDKNKVSIGAIAVILFVVLRLSIGWHFFYEGLHKLNPRNEFSAKGFLGLAKGPTAELYYRMLPDLHGFVRLDIEPKEDVKPFEYVNSEGKPETVDKLPTLPVYEKAWTNFKNSFIARHNLNENQKKEIDAIFGQYIRSLREYAAEIEVPVREYEKSYDRFLAEVAKKTNDAPHQRQRNWDGEMGYRAEGETWIAELDKKGSGLQSAFGRVVSSELGGNPRKLVTDPEKPSVPVPFFKSHMQMLDLGVTIALTAIGFCMLLGFCNRLACLGAAAFLFNVVLSQFPWPGIYPPLPDMIGHFLFVSKDFVEMVACLLLASVPAGRWGGLDFFLYHCGGKKIAQAVGLEETEK